MYRLEYYGDNFKKIKNNPSSLFQNSKKKKNSVKIDRNIKKEQRARIVIIIIIIKKYLSQPA